MELGKNLKLKMDKPILMSICPLMGAQDWTRTSTSLRTLRPEHSASTNFATWAGEKFKKFLWFKQFIVER